MTSFSHELFQEFKRSVMEEYEVSGLGLMHSFLGIKIFLCVEGIFLSHKKYMGYIEEISDEGL